MYMTLLSSFIALLCWLPHAVCWGDLGHRTTAYLAALYLTPAELKQVHRLSGYDDISDAAVWADRVVHEPHYRYSSGWHYLNVHDNPPADCGIQLWRDHADDSSDILTAFVNHTTIATSKDSSPDHLQEALRFLIHWIGDIHQPLHAEGEALGGNRIPVIFDGQNTNLHSVWDVFVPQKLRNTHDNDREAAHSWAADIHERFSKNPLPDECQTPDDAFKCILRWAMESNVLVCQAVLKDGAWKVWQQELNGTYYDTAKVVVEARVAAAGRRMAIWLRVILKAIESNSSISSDSVAQQPLVLV